MLRCDRATRRIALRLSSIARLARLVVVLVWCSGARATAEPVPGPRVTQLASLEFAPGSAALAAVAADAADQLDAAIAWAREHPDGVIVLDAHADPAGTHAHDVRLSLARAKAVRARLVASGVNPHQIVVAVFSAEDGRRDRKVDVWGMRPAEPARTVGDAAE